MLDKIVKSSGGTCSNVWFLLTSLLGGVHDANLWC